MTLYARAQYDERLALLVLLKHHKGGWADLARRVQDAGSAFRIAQEEAYQYLGRS